MITIIGAGRVGTALARASEAAGLPCLLVSRDQHWEAIDPSAMMPIVLCVRNDDLADVLPRIPAARRRDLVFIQNGALTEWLADNGASDSTRGLLYFAVAKRGDPISPGEPLSPFTGRHAMTMATWMGALGVPSRDVVWPHFVVEEGVKLGWLLTHGVLCELYNVDVGTIAASRRSELTALSREVLAVWRAARGVELSTRPFVDRLCEYSASIPTYRASVKEWKWRNGWMVRAARRYRVSAPLHEELLRRTGHGEILDATLDR